MNNIITISTRNFRCGSCIGLYREKLVGKSPCSEQGIVDTSKACKKFNVDSSQMVKSSDTHTSVVNLIKSIRDLPTNLIPHVQTMLVNHDNINRFLRGKYRLLEKVVLNYRGSRDYLSNFCYAYVFDANSSSIKLIGDKGAILFTCDMPSFRRMALSEAEFAPIREQLVWSNKLYDPALDATERRILRPSIRRGEDVDAPELDAAIDSDNIDSDALSEADVGELLQELSDHGTVARTNSKVKQKHTRWRDAEIKNKEDYEEGDESADEEGADKHNFSYTNE